MGKFNFLADPSRTSEPIAMFEKFVPYIFNGIVVIGIIMFCIGIMTLIYNKCKKKKSTTPAMLGVSGAITCVVATLSYYLTTYEPSDFSSTVGGSGISSAILIIIAIAFILFLMDEKRKEQ